MLIRPGSTPRSRMAFTLVEVLVTVVIVAVLFTALFTGLAQGVAFCSASRERLRANQVALERIEGIRLVKWSDLTNTNFVPRTFTTTYAPFSQNKGVLYNGDLTIGSAGLSPTPTYADSVRKITVRVTWLSGSVQRSHTIATYVSRNGLQNYVYNN
jgi:prepilin-type N-terminal cleavage/methylation domain-containing protein